ncbi:MAG: sensor histidine kinase [Treponema sp.]|nr:sensor histidine kinase [Treponema sp.]
MKKFLLSFIFFIFSVCLFSQTKSFEEVQEDYESFILNRDLSTLRSFSLTLDLFKQNNDYISFNKNTDYSNAFTQLNNTTKQILNTFDHPWEETTDSNYEILSTNLINERFSYFLIIHTAYNSRQMLFYKMLTINFVIILILIFSSTIFFLNYKKEKQKKLLFTNALLSGQESERKRISKELHDTIAQNLKVQKILLLNMKEKNKDGLNIEEDLDEAFQQSKNNITEIRSICQNLFPPDFENQKLDWIVAELCENVKNKSGISCTYFADPESLFFKMEKEQKLNLFRIIQEAVNNAVYHSECSNIKIYITKNELIISDNGKGFNYEKELSTKINHFGLRSIKERSILINTTLEIQSNEMGSNIHLKLK